MADIGDMQSVSGDLSTFSGHLVICREMLDRVQWLSKQYATKKNKNRYEDNYDNDNDDGDGNQQLLSSLVLLDEIGTGKRCYYHQ